MEMNIFSDFKVYSPVASTQQVVKYQHLHLMHAAIFDSKIAKKLGAYIFKTQFWN